MQSRRTGAPSSAERDLLDQVEQAIVGPVSVVDPDHQRALAGQQRRRAGAMRASARPRRLRRIGSPPRAVPSAAASSSASSAPSSSSRLASAAWTSPTESSALAPAAARRISPSAQKAIPRPYGGLRPRSTGRRVRTRAQLGDQLAGQPRLADAGLAGDRDQLGHPLASGSAVDQPQQVEVVLAGPTKRRRLLRPLGAAATARQTRSGCREALRVDRASVLELGGAAGARRSLADQDLAGCGRLLQASRGVHRLAGDREVAGALERQHLAGLDADAQGQSVAQRPDAVPQGQRSGDRPVRVVAVGATELRTPP